MKIIKKIFIFAVVFVLAIIAFSFSFSNVKANSLATSDKLVVEGAAMRTLGNAGMKFGASIGDFDTSNVKSYGIAIAYGNVSVSDDFKVGGTVSGKAVLSTTVDELDNEGKYHVVLWNIPESGYVQDVTARAFVVLNDDSIVYSTTVTTRNLAQVAIAVKNNGYDGGLIDNVLESSAIDNNFKKVIKLYNGAYLIGNPRIEYNLDVLAAEFLADYNDIQGTEIPSMTGWAAQVIGAYSGSFTENQVKADKVYTFFTANGGEMLTKWAWLLDALKSIANNPYVTAQVNIMRGTSSEWTSWYGARHLASRLEGFFTHTQCTSTSFHSEFYGDSYRPYYNCLLNSTIPSQSFENLYQIGKSFELGSNIVTRDGYYYDGYSDGDVGDFVEVSSNNKLIQEEEHLTTYSITYYDGEDLINETPNTYNIESAVELPSLIKDGFVFLGWCSNSNLSDTPLFAIPLNTTGNKTLYAKWGLPPAVAAARVGLVEYETIQEAINSCSAGGTVTVLPGTYTTDITIDKSLNLYTENATYNPTEDLSRFVDSNTKVVLDCKINIVNSNTLSNIEIKGFSFTASARIGEYNTGSANTRYISGFVFENNYVYDTDDIEITYKHNYYNNAGYNSTSLYSKVPGFIALAGTYSWSKNPQIKNNVFDNVQTIVYYTVCCQGLTFTGNVLKDCYGAIRADYSSTQGTLNIKNNSFENIKYSAIHLRSYGGSSLTMNVLNNYFKNVAYNQDKYFDSSYIGIVSTNGYGEKTNATFNIKYNVMENCGGYINIRSNVTNVETYAAKGLTYVANVQYNSFIDSSSPKYNKCFSNSDNASTNYAIGRYSNNFYGSSTTTAVAITSSQFENVDTHESESAYNDVASLSAALAALNTPESLGVLKNVPSVN